MSIPISLMSRKYDTIKLTNLSPCSMPPHSLLTNISTVNITAGIIFTIPYSTYKKKWFNAKSNYIKDPAHTFMVKEQDKFLNCHHSPSPAASLWHFQSLISGKFRTSGDHHGHLDKKCTEVYHEMSKILDHFNCPKMWTTYFYSL